MKFKNSLLLAAGVVVSLAFIVGCKKDKSILFEDNDVPYYDGIPKVKVQNYINRIFIDLIGREPFDAEMLAEENALRAADFSEESRITLISKLQTNKDYISGDSSYWHAYYNRFYELCKARTIQAAADGELTKAAGLSLYAAKQDSLAGDSIGMMAKKEVAEQCYRVVRSQIEYREGLIEINEVFGRMINNRVYDNIVCAGYRFNAFNILNYTFDHMFFRFPIQEEFDAGYQMCQFEKVAVLFGKSGQNRGDYTNILVNSQEFYEGVVRWLYINLMAREPTATELSRHMLHFFNDHNVQQVQIDIMKTDEYANF